MKTETTSTRGRPKKTLEVDPIKKEIVADEPTSNKYVVITETARVRERNRPLSIIKKELKKGDKIEVIEIQGEWAKTKDGYMLSKQIKKQ